MLSKYYIAVLSLWVQLLYPYVNSCPYCPQRGGVPVQLHENVSEGEGKGIGHEIVTEKGEEVVPDLRTGDVQGE